MQYILAGIFLVLLITYNLLLEIVSLLRFLPVTPEDYKVPDGDSVCGNLYKRGYMDKETYEREVHLSYSSSSAAYLGYIVKVTPLLWLMSFTTMFDKITYNIVNHIWLKKLEGHSIEELHNIAKTMSAHKRSQNLGIAILKVRTIAKKAYYKGSLFLIAPLTLVSTGLLQFSSSIALHLAMAGAFLIIALLLETLLGSIDISKLVKRSKFYDMILYTTAVLSIALFWGFVVNIIVNDIPIMLSIAMGINIALVNAAISYIVGHELGHRKEFIPNFLSNVIFVNLLLLSFKEVHNIGHHGDVATEKDIITAHRDESLYSYLYKTISTIYTRAAEIRTSLAVTMVLSQAVMLGVTIIYYPSVFVFFIIQLIVGLLLLESVNYVEHYGLMQDGNDLNNTSWDCTNTLTNGFLFNLGHHAHHHKNSSVKFYNLEQVSDYKVSEGYLVLILTALFPLRWFKLMNTKIDNIRKI